MYTLISYMASSVPPIIALYVACLVLCGYLSRTGWLIKDLALEGHYFRRCRRGLQVSRRYPAMI